MDKTEEKDKTQLNDSNFNRKDQEKYWKKKYLKEHIFDFFIGLIILLLFYFLFPRIIEIDKSKMIYILPLFIIAEIGYFRNRMMIYIESKIYDK